MADIALLDELVALLGPVPHDPQTSDSLFLDSGEVAEIVTTADRLSDNRELDLAEPHSTYTHVLVDEAQDITPMQWRMLRRRGPQASWTIVGDPAQSSWPDLSETDRAVRDLIGSAPHRTFRLSTNYRSPREVFDLAAAYIVRHVPDADLPQAVRSTGIEPLLLDTTEDRWADQARAETARLLGQVEGADRRPGFGCRAPAGGPHPTRGQGPGA